MTYNTWIRDTNYVGRGGGFFLNGNTRSGSYSNVYILGYQRKNERLYRGIVMRYW